MTSISIWHDVSHHRIYILVVLTVTIIYKRHGISLNSKAILERIFSIHMSEQDSTWPIRIDWATRLSWVWVVTIHITWMTMLDNIHFSAAWFSIPLFNLIFTDMFFLVLGYWVCKEIHRHVYTSSCRKFSLHGFSVFEGRRVFSMFIFSNFILVTGKCVFLGSLKTCLFVLVISDGLPFLSSSIH